MSVKKLDAVIVGYLGMGGAAREIQKTLTDAGLKPPANTGTEAVARMLGLRLNHPAAQDGLELRPLQAITRAEAAYSFAQLLTLDESTLESVQAAADAFTLPGFTPWQQRVLTTAIHYVGYPYIWGGTSPGPETLFGVSSGGGFDCSGFVWRVYKLTAYTGEGTLASVLRGRTTYQMSGEVPRSDADHRREPPARRRDVLRRERPEVEAERRRPHRALPRERLVRAVERRRRHASAVRRLVRAHVRVGAPAAARSRAQQLSPRLLMGRLDRRPVR